MAHSTQTYNQKTSLSIFSFFFFVFVFFFFFQEKKMAVASSKTTDEVDIEKYLEAEATQLERDAEVERVLKAFKLNPYDILDLPITADEK